MTCPPILYFTSENVRQSENPFYFINSRQKCEWGALSRGDSCPLHPPNLQFLVTSAQLLLRLPSLIDISFSRLGPGPPHFWVPRPFEQDRHKAKMCWLHETFFGCSPIFCSGTTVLATKLSGLSQSAPLLASGPGYGPALLLSPASCALWTLLSPHGFGRWWLNPLMDLCLWFGKTR